MLDDNNNAVAASAADDDEKGMQGILGCSSSCIVTMLRSGKEETQSIEEREVEDEA